MGCKYRRTPRTFDGTLNTMKYLISIALLNAVPLFGQWYASAGLEQQVYSSTRLKSPVNPTFEFGNASEKSKLSIRIPLEPNSTHWSQPSWWGSMQFQRSVYDFAKFEQLPAWFPDFKNSAYCIVRLSSFRKQTVVEDHVSGYANGLWYREKYSFTYLNPSLGLGAGLSSRIKNIEFYLEGIFQVGTELQTSVYKGTLNVDGTQTSLESYTYNEKLRFLSISIGLRRYFERE